MDSSEINEQLIQGILQYLVQHPDAKDTPEGIYKWWLPEGYTNRGRDEVYKALEFLTSQGWLLRRQTRRHEEIYGLNKEYLEEITDFLTQAKWH